MSNSEHITTGKGIFGSYYAKDSKGNSGSGNTEQAAIEALKSAQNQEKK